MSLKHFFRTLSLPITLCLAALLPARAGMISPDQILKAGTVKDAFAKLAKDAKDKASYDAIAKAATAGDKDALFTQAFALQSGLGGVEAPKDKPLALIEQAKDLYKKAADAGSMAALNNLGLVKLAVGDDAKQSIAHVEEAANKGYGKARISLAQLYLEGAGVEKNPNQAIIWLERAEQGDEPLEAGFLIAQYLEANNNLGPAIEKLTKCADAGHVPSMLYLGNKYLSGGKGLPQDVAKAQELFTKAEAKDAVAGTVSLGLVSELQGGAEKDEAKQKEFFKKALAKYEQAAQKNVPDAHNKLGFFYENGLGVAKDDAKAREYYKKGADAGLTTSMFNYGLFVEEGRGGVEKNPADGMKFVYDAAKGGLPQAMINLGERYRNGTKGVDRDPIAAMAWIERAAQGGNPGAMVMLANMLETGEAGFVNLETAAKLYLEGVKQGQVFAAYQLGDMLEKGRGMNQDLVKAYGFLGVAAKVLGKDEKNGKNITERFGKLKERLTADQLKQGEAFLKQLMGNADAGEKPADKPADKPAATPSKPKAEEKPTTKPKTK